MTEAYYNEVVANLTWYKLNSDYMDPMYQYMLKVEQDLYNKIKPPKVLTYYKTYDDSVTLTNATLRYGSYQCSVPGKEAFMDSAFSCFLFQLPFFLENIQIGYIGFVFVLPIMLISIFGGIKESYKWFILNQAIWDAFLCYDFICSKPTLFGWSKNYLNETTCFYRDISDQNFLFLHTILSGFRTFLRNASFVPVFHLALSRFLAMYFPMFYKNFTKNGYKILIFILIFNIICITIFSFTTSAISLFANSVVQEIPKCNDFCSIPSNYTYCFQNFPKYFQCINKISVDVTASSDVQFRMTKIFKYISYFIPPIMFLLSIICAGFLFYKIASHLKFQLKTNPESFKQTIKISSVVGFQCLTMSIIFVITVIQKFMLVKSFFGDSFNTFYFNHYNELPPWLFLLQNYTTTTSLNMIRILLDSCIILTVLSGYSKCVISTLKFLWLCLRNPKKAFKKVKYNIKGTEVTNISIKSINR